MNSPIHCHLTPEQSQWQISSEILSRVLTINFQIKAHARFSRGCIIMQDILSNRMPKAESEGHDNSLHS